MEEEKRRPGRPSGVPNKFNKETIDDVLLGVRLGMKFGDAAEAAGIHPNTFAKWIVFAKKGRKPYVEILEDLGKAIAEAKKTHLKFINKHAVGGIKIEKVVVRVDSAGNIIEKVTTTESTLPNLKASIWILERRHPKEFGPKQEVALTNSDNPFQVTLFGQALMGSGYGQEDQQENADAAV